MCVIKSQIKVSNWGEVTGKSHVNGSNADFRAANSEIKGANAEVKALKRGISAETSGVGGGRGGINALNADFCRAKT